MAPTETSSWPWLKAQNLIDSKMNTIPQDAINCIELLAKHTSRAQQLESDCSRYFSAVWDFHILTDSDQRQGGPTKRYTREEGKTLLPKLMMEIDQDIAAIELHLRRYAGPGKDKAFLLLAR